MSLLAAGARQLAPVGGWLFVLQKVLEEIRSHLVQSRPQAHLDCLQVGLIQLSTFRKDTS